MQTRYEVQPELYEFLLLPNGKHQIFLRENITKIQTEDHEYWEANEYSITSNLSENFLRNSLANNYIEWLAFAKEKSEVESISSPDIMELMADHEERICLLELGVEI